MVTGMNGSWVEALRPLLGLFFPSGVSCPDACKGCTLGNLELGLRAARHVGSKTIKQFVDDAYYTIS